MMQGREATAPGNGPLATSTEGEEIIELDIDFSGVLWTSGSLGVNVEAITDAIMRLAKRLRKEADSRRSLELKLLDLGSNAEQAKDLAESAAEAVAAKDISGKQGSEVSGIEKADIEKLDFRMQRVEQTVAHHRKQQEQRSQNLNEILGLRLDNMNRDIQKRIREEDLQQHDDKLMFEARQLVDERSKVAQEAASADARRVQDVLIRMNAGLEERLRLYEARLEALEQFPSTQGGALGADMEDGRLAADLGSGDGSGGAEGGPGATGLLGPEGTAGAPGSAGLLGSGTGSAKGAGTGGLLGLGGLTSVADADLAKRVTDLEAHLAEVKGRLATAEGSQGTQPADIFGEIDKNNDGVITRDEFDAATGGAGDSVQPGEAGSDASQLGSRRGSRQAGGALGSRLGSRQAGGAHQDFEERFKNIEAELARLGGGAHGAAGANGVEEGSGSGIASGSNFTGAMGNTGTGNAGGAFAGNTGIGNAEGGIASSTGAAGNTGAGNAGGAFAGNTGVGNAEGGIAGAGNAGDGPIGASGSTGAAGSTGADADLQDLFNRVQALEEALEKTGAVGDPPGTAGAGSGTGSRTGSRRGSGLPGSGGRRRSGDHQIGAAAGATGTAGIASDDAEPEGDAGISPELEERLQAIEASIEQLGGGGAISGSGDANPGGPGGTNGIAGAAGTGAAVGSSGGASIAGIDDAPGAAASVTDSKRLRDLEARVSELAGRLDAGSDVGVGGNDSIVANGAPGRGTDGRGRGTRGGRDHSSSRPGGVPSVAGGTPDAPANSTNSRRGSHSGGHVQQGTGAADGSTGNASGTGGAASKPSAATVAGVGEGQAVERRVSNLEAQLADLLKLFKNPQFEDLMKQLNKANIDVGGASSSGQPGPGGPSSSGQGGPGRRPRANRPSRGPAAADATLGGGATAGAGAGAGSGGADAQTGVGGEGVGHDQTGAGLRGPAAAKAAGRRGGSQRGSLLDTLNAGVDKAISKEEKIGRMTPVPGSPDPQAEGEELVREFVRDGPDSRPPSARKITGVSGVDIGMLPRRPTADSKMSSTDVNSPNSLYQQPYNNPEQEDFNTWVRSEFVTIHAELVRLDEEMKDQGPASGLQRRHNWRNANPSRRPTKNSTAESLTAQTDVVAGGGSGGTGDVDGVDAVRLYNRLYEDLYANLKEEWSAAGRLQGGDFGSAAVAPQPVAVQNTVDVDKQGPVTREELYKLQNAQNALASGMQNQVLDVRRELLVALDKVSKEITRVNQLRPQQLSARSRRSSGNDSSSASPAGRLSHQGSMGAIDGVGGTGPSPTTSISIPEAASPLGAQLIDSGTLRRIEEALVQQVQDELADWVEDQRAMLQMERSGQDQRPMLQVDRLNQESMLHSLQARIKELEKAMQFSPRTEGLPSPADESGVQSSLNTLRGKSRQLESRVITLEHAAGAAEKDAEKLDSFEREFAIIKQRLEDLQKTMGGLGDANGGDGAVSVAEALAKMNRSMEDRASDEKREMENLYRAVRGVQRESERTAGKLDDVVNGLDALKKRVDVTIPQILNMIEVDGGRSGEEGAEAQKSRAKRLQLLREAFEGGKVPAPFASLEALQKATHDTDENTKGQLGRMKKDIQDALNGKADSEALHMLAAQLEAALREMRSLIHALQVSSSSEGSVDNAAFVRLPFLAGRCVSCDKKVDMTYDKSNPWDSGAVPNTPWPNRVGQPRTGVQQRVAVGRDPLLPRIDSSPR